MITIKQKLLDSITSQLDYFFPETTIYTQLVPQGFSKPCFTVEITKSKQQTLLSNRYKLYNSIHIQYFPSQDLNECNHILSKLFENMKTLTFDKGFILGQNLSASINQNVVDFYVDYDFHFFEKLHTNLMDNLITY